MTGRPGGALKASLLMVYPPRHQLHKVSIELIIVLLLISNNSSLTAVSLFGSFSLSIYLTAAHAKHSKQVGSIDQCYMFTQAGSAQKEPTSNASLKV